MDHYSYLNQGFDPTCTLSSPMDSLQSACQITCSGYADLAQSQCSQIPPGYGRYQNTSGPSPMGTMRPNPISPTNGSSMITGCMANNVAAAAAAAAAVASRSHHSDHHHHHSMQSSMFQTGIGLQSKRYQFSIIFIDFFLH